MKPLVKLEYWNKEVAKKYEGLQSSKNSIECPICGEELWDDDPRFIVATFPPKRKVFCKSCDFVGYKLI